MSNNLLMGLVVAVILAVVLVAVLLRPGRRRDTQSLYTEGLDHLLRGNLQQAYKAFKAVIGGDTDNVSAYLKMGQTLRDAGAPQKALKLHESLLARPSLSSYERLELYRNLALDNSALGDHAKAIKWASAILKLEKRNLWALRNLIKFYRDIGDWESCGKYLLQWQKTTGKPDTRLLALCRFRQGYDQRDSSDPATVRAHYQQALKVDGKFAPAHYFLAESYTSEAHQRRQELRTGGDGTSKNVTPADGSRDKMCVERYTQAVSHWTAFVGLSPQDTYRVLPAVEEALFYLQRFDDLELFLKQVLEKEPGNPDAVASLANFYVRKGELDRAEGVLGQLPDSDQPAALIQAIRLKLRYRRNAEDNIMPDLDRLVDSIQLSISGGSAMPSATVSMLSWLEPSGDPLEVLA